MTDEGVFSFQFGDFRTLQLYFIQARLLERLEPFSKSRASVEYVSPEYTPMQYAPTPELLNHLGRDPSAAVTAIRSWVGHVSNYAYYVQFKDDTDRKLIRALHAHTETLSTLCDSRLKIDPTPAWTYFDGLFSFAGVHFEYRADPDREEKWDHYSKRLKKVYDRLTEGDRAIFHFIQRVAKQVELQAAAWHTLPPLHVAPLQRTAKKSITLFYSYSHRDEALRDQLQTHLSLLRRQGVIDEWHDRRISAGTEWEGSIDKHLAGADLVLLLISSDFLASDYCYDIEVNTAMARHEKGDARVIPVILRACDWHGAPFGKLQAIPKDGEPVTSWSNIDEALTDVAKGIRRAAAEIVGT